MNARPLVVATSFAIAGCASSPPPAQDLIPAGPRPSDAEVIAAIKAHFSRTLQDPDSVKQFAITKGPYERTYRPFINQPWRNGWIVCFQYNAKNSYGAYVGVRSGAVGIHTNPPPATVIDTLPIEIPVAWQMYCS